MSKNLRYLQHSRRARIEHDLVLTRLGELMIRDLDILTKSLIYPVETGSIEAVILKGLIASSSSGLVVDLSAPAVAIQNIGNDDVRICFDDNNGTDFSVTLATADPTNPRIDIIEARITKRSEFTDSAVDIVDPVTKVVTPQSKDRDYEIHLEVQKIDGTPAGSPTPPSPTSATAGSITGTVVDDVLDLSSKYLLSLTVGPDGEYIEIDLRGGTPAATTRAERISAINGAGFGTIATNVGGAIKITAPGTGQDSIVKIKQPLDPSLDAYNLVLGGTETLGYYDQFPGGNAWFKIAEVYVPATATSLTADNIRTRSEKDTDWDADADTIENGYHLEGHRHSNPLDHEDGSVFINHLDSSVTSLIQSKITSYRGANAPTYPVSGDATFRKGTVFLEDIECIKEDGNTQANIVIEQEYPVNRVDQRQETTGGAGYAVPTNLSEAAADKHPFTVGALVNAGGQYYQITEFEENHSRVGVYITNGGSISGFTHMRITLHNSADISQGYADIPIADLQSVGIGWIYIDLSATLVNGQTYHYHFSLVGAGAVTTVQLATDGSLNLTFREMYLPTAGYYGSASESDLIKPLDSAGARLIPVRASGADDILSPGDGFIGESGLDIMVEDFSNTTYWTNWNYQGYVGIDLSLGRMKFPSGQNVNFIFVEFNIKEGMDARDAKNYLRHISEISLEESLINLEEGYLEKEITEIDPDTGTTIYESIVGNSNAVVFPVTGTPEGNFIFMARNPGQYHENPLLFRMLYSMSSSNAGVVKIDFDIYVDGSFVATRSITIDPPNDTSRSSIATSKSNLYIGDTEFSTNSEVKILISRDNTVGSNHTGNFQLFGLSVI